LPERARRFVFLARAKKDITEHHPARGVLLVERACLAQRDGGSAKLASAT
jgi:hypothetical protein